MTDVGGHASNTTGIDVVSNGSVSVRVVESVAEREGVDPSELERPLYDVVDPDALTTLATNPAGDGLRISFTYLGYDVTVTDAGDVDVADADAPEASAESREGLTATGEDGMD